IEGVLQRFFVLAEKRGVARLLAWLILSGRDLGPMRAGGLKPTAERMHAGRVRSAQRVGRPIPALESSLLAATFLSILVLGDALFGPVVRASIGLGSDAAAS